MRATSMLLFVLFINVFFFLGSTAMEKVGGEVDFFNYEGSWMQVRDSGNFTLNEDITLPESQSAVSPDQQGNFFTDTWRTITTWLRSSIPGYDFIERVINGPILFLQAAQLPAEISFVIGWLWHMLGLFVFVTWVRSGQA